MTKSQFTCSSVSEARRHTTRLVGCNKVSALKAGPVEGDGPQSSGVPYPPLSLICSLSLPSLVGQRRIFGGDSV